MRFQALGFLAALLKRHRKTISALSLMIVLMQMVRPVRTVKSKVPNINRMSFYEFIKKVDKKEIENVVFSADALHFKLNSEVFATSPPKYFPGIADYLLSKDVPFDDVLKPRSSMDLKTILTFCFPFVYLLISIIAFKKFLSPANDSTFQKKENSRTDNKVNFHDIAGIPEAKQLVLEITQFFKEPYASELKEIGAKIPSGVLLCGPPGTGKTLLAKAMASEISIPFFYAAGSEFVEIYAGRGAARVRKLFAHACKHAPCVLFIDEIDAIGKKRSQNEFASSEEREQTLNQLLALMDGFDSSNVVVIGATNRLAMLDRALTRPGRFDRVIQVGLPDAEGREKVLQVHSRKLNTSAVNFQTLASVTAGFSGAELASICNEAAISAVRRRSATVCMQDFMASIRSFNLSRRT